MFGGSPRSPSLCCRALVWMLGLLFVSAPANAAGPSSVRVVAEGECPSAQTVERELRRVVPSLEVRPTDASAAPLSLREEGAGVVARFESAERLFEDGAPCEERAVQIAVWVALLLEPLRSPREPALPEQAAPAQSSSLPSLQLEFGPILAAAPVSHAQGVPLAGGGALRLVAGSGLSVTAGVALLSSTTLHYARAEAGEAWLPIDLGARLGWSLARWDVDIEASAVVAPAYLQGQGLDLTKSGVRVELGARGALVARWWLDERIALCASEAATWWPSPVTLRVGGVGEVGRTPPLWLYSQFGLALKIN